MMSELGQSDNPVALIPGSPDAINEIAWSLTQYGDVLREAGEGLSRIDTTSGWSGPAAAAFRKVFDGQPGKWTQAGDAFHHAANALDSYAAALTWAQQEAARAISLWAGGKPYRQAAQSVLSSARDQLDAAGNKAAGIVGHARDQAPPKPGFWSQVGSVFSDAGHDVAHAGETAIDDLASLGNAAITDPGALAAAVGGTALAGISAVGDGFGAALDATGVGAVAGVPLNALSTAGVVAGAGIAGAGLTAMAQDAAGSDHISPMNSGDGGDSGGHDSTLGDDPPSEITGRTTHGDAQAQSRDGHGVGDEAMADAVQNPIQPVEPQPGGRYKYVGKDAVVVLNQNGKVITTWATNSAGWRIP
jgi:uncharacterized protein YukE